jgi:hypothetical protein
VGKGGGREGLRVGKGRGREGLSVGKGRGREGLRVGKRVMVGNGRVKGGKRG